MQPGFALRLVRAGRSGIGGHVALRMAVILTAIAALLWQSFIVQTHIHYPAVAVHAATGVSHRAHPAEAPADCPICREMAQAAAYLTPTSPPLAEPARAHFLLAELPITASVFVAFAPAWRSRAPPPALRI